MKSDSGISASTSRVDRAWGVVAGAGLLMFVNLGPVLYYTTGVFTKAITDDTGWTRGTIAAAGLPANLLITLTLPLVGWAVDTYGTRRIAIFSSILFGVVYGAVTGAAVGCVASLTGRWFKSPKREIP